MKDNTGFEFIFNSGMKVFSQLFVAHRPAKKEIPLAYATPFEDNAAGKKRQATALGWAGTGALQKLVENVPRSGFRITDSLKRVYYGGGNVVWRVQDPDGWEIEIESANLQALIAVAGLQPGGEINGKCLWGRAEGKNILLHETSDEFKNAIQAAETLKKPKEIGVGERTIGMKYLTVSGDIVIYLGKMWVHAIKADEAGEDRRVPIRLLDPVKYDVVAKANYNDAYDILLYKKAPLVREEGKSQWDETDLPSIISMCEYGGYYGKTRYPVSFASNTTNIPMLIQLEKTDARWSLRPHTGKSDINYAIRDHHDYSWVDGKHVSRKIFKLMHGSLFMTEFGRYGNNFNSCVYKRDDGKLFSGHTYGYDSHLPEVLLTDKTIRIATEGNNYSRASLYEKDNSVEFALFETKKAATDFINDLRKNGQVVEFHVEAC